jgi:phenylalanyl-tRNA synthetase alpha chain
VKNSISSEIQTKSLSLTRKKTNIKNWFDLTIPGKKINVGKLHPHTKVLNDLIDIFTYLGYQVADGPEVETDYYNFTALNFPQNHPARDAQQSMYFKSKNKHRYVPRTHTSSMQARVMEKTDPPLKVIVPGRCFRYEQVDASHAVEFTQLEGFAVDKNLTFTDLLGTIEYVLQNLFGKNVPIRFANTYFPFVEPGLDAYIKCTVCGGKGCSFCKNAGWSEIMPAGMIHPNVLKNSNISPEKWNGFAFAIGLSRIVTLKYQINDLRYLTNPNMDVLNQFQ